MACTVKIKEDTDIANGLGISIEEVTSLRGKYETIRSTKFDISDINKAIAEMVKFRAETRRHDAIQKYMNDPASAYENLSLIYTAQIRNDRVNMIATLFSSVLDNMQQNNGVSRVELCNGYIKSDGTRAGGQFEIFEKTYQQILMLRKAFLFQAQKYENNPGIKNSFLNKITKLDEVLNNWGPLCSYARIVLRDTEGLKMGKKLDYATETNDGDFGDNDLAQLFDPENSRKEGWQEVSDFMSSFAAVGANVRRVLATINVIKDGKIQQDDLGFSRKLNPVSAHQALLEELRGMVTSEDMMNILRNSSLPYASQIVTVLEKNPQLRTQFFVDLSKDFQPYRSMSIRNDNGVITIKTTTKNRVRNLLSGLFKSRVKYGSVINVTGSVYGSFGEVNWENLKKFTSLINEIFSQNGILASKFWDNNTNWQDIGMKIGIPLENKREYFYHNRAVLLSYLSTSVGVDLNVDDAERILKKGGVGRKYIQALTELVFSQTKAGQRTSTGFSAVLTSDEQRDRRRFSTFTDLYHFATESQKRSSKIKQIGNVQEKIDRMLEILSGQREGMRMESRCIHKDRKGKTNALYSYVNPSYLSTFAKQINRFAQLKDSQGLKNFLDEKFGKSSMFKDANGRWLCKWIEELYNADLEADNNIAIILEASRFLGGDNLDFKDFTSKQHTLAMMHDFFFADNLTDSSDKVYKKDSRGNYLDREGTIIIGGTSNPYFSSLAVSTNRRYANYPVFILGDSGVCKTLKGKIYTKEEIIDGMYSIYKTEVQRQKLSKEANADLTRKGYKTIDGITGKEDLFVMLPFLNKDYSRQVRQSDGTVVTINYSSIWNDSTISTEDKVKRIIRQEMEYKVAEFKDFITKLGVLEGNGTKYFTRELGNYANKGGLDAMLEDFFWNTKFATLNQFQMMTIDVAFYKSTKDLQKRYKEIHAPGTILDLTAKDFDGNYYNPIDNMGNPSPERVIYFDDPQVNAESFNNEFMQAIIANFKGKPGGEDIIDVYKKNALADGQGYRTLDSYRKVMGMAGKWSKEMETTYNLIKKFRGTYGLHPDTNRMNPTLRANYYADLQAISDMAVVFQPIKPYLYGFENYPVGTDVLKIPVQHKYAEAVLIPELLPDGLCKDMAVFMENNHIDVAGAWSKGGDKIVKVGGFGSTPIQHCTDAESLNIALSKAYVHQLSYADYKIQTNVPEHINSSQLFGTQLRKLIMAGINMNADYSLYLGGETVNLGGSLGEAKLNGRNLINFWNSLIVGNILESYHDFEEEMSSPESLSRILQQGVINNSRESYDNLLAYSLDEVTGDFIVPLAEGGQEHDAAALLWSLFKKAVNKQKIKGGSAVQVSAMGIKGYEESGDLKCVVDPNNPNNILYAEVEVPFDLSIKVGSKEIPLVFEDWCNPDGTLKINPRYAKRKEAEEFNEKVNKLYNKYFSESKYPRRNASGNIHPFDIKVNKDDLISLLDELGETEAANDLRKGMDMPMTLEYVEDYLFDSNDGIIININEDEIIPETLIEASYPGILNRIAYRIPTENDYSMINMRIKRFSHKTAGGTIKVPAQGTSIAGFDFDIKQYWCH